MHNFSVVVLKTLLTSICTLSIMLSVLLMCLLFDISIQGGIPPLETLRFSVSLFFVIILLFIVCGCLKFILDMSIDSRNLSIKKLAKANKRPDDILV